MILTLCHPLDYLRWIIGEVSELWAFTSRIGDLDLEVEDTAEIGLRFSNGALGSVHLDYNQQPTTHRLEIIGTQGTIHWDNNDGEVNMFGSKNKKWETFPLAKTFERNDMFLDEMRHFLNVIQAKELPICTLDDGIEALKITLAANESARRGQLINPDKLH